MENRYIVNLAFAIRDGLDGANKLRHIKSFNESFDVKKNHDISTYKFFYWMLSRTSKVDPFSYDMLYSDLPMDFRYVEKASKIFLKTLRKAARAEILTEEEWALAEEEVYPLFGGPYLNICSSFLDLRKNNIGSAGDEFMYRYIHVCFGHDPLFYHKASKKLLRLVASS